MPPVTTRIFRIPSVISDDPGGTRSFKSSKRLRTIHFLGGDELATAIRAFNDDRVDISGLSFNPLAGIHGG